MSPELEDDDVVLTVRTRRIRAGDIVVAAHPYKSSVIVVKRVVGVDAMGRFDLRGDSSSESTDSRTFGAIPLDHIRGKVVCRFARRGE